MQELNEFDIISKIEVKRLLKEFEEQNMNFSEDEKVEFNQELNEGEVKNL